MRARCYNQEAVALDATSCYRAVAARDPRFDGKFFTAVVSTGIFCRPICPAKTPRNENCRFFPSAAAAMAAGFRPCLRCRPETSPGAPAWNGTSAVVTRALRLIEQGALDHSSLPALCDRLGVGERQLRRLFDQHLGASPSAVDGSRRLMLAKKLLTDTALPIGEIAYAAGYRSPRRFREAVRSAYGRAPSAMRGGGADSDSIELHLGFRPPYDREAMLSFLAARAIPGVEEVRDGTYRRTVRLGEDVGRFEAHIGDCELVARFSGLQAKGLPAAIARVRTLFDLSADPAAIGRGLSGDPVLAELNTRRPGLRVPGAWDGFELCVRAVLGQQVTVAGASTLEFWSTTRY